MKDINWDNKEDVLETLSDWQENFKFASDRLKNDKEFISELMFENGYFNIFQYISQNV